MVTLLGIALTVKEFVSLYVFMHPKCRGYEIRHAYFEVKFGRKPVTKEDRDWNGSMTSCNAGGGLAVAKSGQRHWSCSRYEDRILVKDFHTAGRAVLSCKRRKPPTFTLTNLGINYAASALQKLARAGVTDVQLLGSL